MRRMVISGIRPGFPGLSQSQGQVAHVLLTRSPLEYPRRGLSARLACVKHAASVRPEPGSNSPLRSKRHTHQTASAPNLDETNPSKNHLAKGIQNQSNPKRAIMIEDHNALAFNTLLSSQETDTHHQTPSRASSGATLQTYHPYPGCQISNQDPTCDRDGSRHASPDHDDRVRYHRGSSSGRPSRGDVL